MTGPTTPAEERAALEQLLDDWIGEARRRAAAGDDPDLVWAGLALGLAMATDEQLADLAATAIRRLAALADAADGPQDADPVGVTTPRRGIDMHRLDQPTAAMSGCGRSTRTWTVTTAANARGRWDSQPCRGCWPGAS